MKFTLLALALLITSHGFGQWTIMNIPSAGRYDDVFFINNDVGWVAGGDFNEIYKTTDGGANWALQFSGSKYLRCIVFATPTLGFCGSLDSSFYKTTDGGTIWIDIADSIAPKPQGICGLSAPTQNVIYGAGIWSSPAYLIKSVDGGSTWSTIDVSAYANALVDVHFISADTGFVAGMANPDTDGGVILYTTDGGATWTVKLKTLYTEDYIWKFQNLDGVHFYGSVEGHPMSGNVRWVHSSDGGMTWTMDTIQNTFSPIQSMGFIDTLHGWTGGDSTLFETTNGGISWASVNVGSTYNRFLKVNDSTAYLTGNRLYKYSAGDTLSILDYQPFDEIHALQVSPNPTSKFIEIEMGINNRTNCRLQLFSSDGKLVKTLYNSPVEKGVKHFTVSLESYSPQTFFVILKTNEGLIYRKFVKG